MRKRASVVLAEIYHNYALECKRDKRTPIPREKFIKYCEYANMELVNAVVFEAKEVALPYGMASFSVLRIARNFNKPTVDWKATNALKVQGIDSLVYYTDDDYYKFNWHGGKCHLPYKSLWRFTPTSGNYKSIGGVKYILSQAIRSRPDLRIRYKYKNL